jgi:hypothetical protein
MVSLPAKWLLRQRSQLAPPLLSGRGRSLGDDDARGSLVACYPGKFKSHFDYIDRFRARRQDIRATGH